MIKVKTVGSFGKFEYEIGVTHSKEQLSNVLGLPGIKRASEDTWHTIDMVKEQSCIIDGPSTQEILALKAITARYGKLISVDYLRIVLCLYLMNYIQNIVNIGGFDIWGTDSLRIWESEGSDAAKAVKPSTDAERLILVYMGYPYLKSNWFAGYERQLGLDALKVTTPKELIGYIRKVFHALTKLSWEGGRA